MTDIDITCSAGQEMPFVLSDLALEVLGNFCLVWLLSPRRVFKQSTGTGLTLFVSKLPGHCLQVSINNPLVAIGFPFCSPVG